METILKIRDICKEHHSCYDNCPFHVDNECVLSIPPANWSDEDLYLISKALNEEVNACSECEFFSDTRFYADNSILVSLGCCMKCQRNMTTTNPHTEIPTWCPLKKENEECQLVRSVKEATDEELKEVVKGER